MKIRWSGTSVRFRISPAELAALLDGAPVGETLALGGGWRATIRPGAPRTALALEGGELVLALSDADRERLAAPEAEGVYFETGDAAVRYYLEKDFPCAHPRASEAREPADAAFAPTPGYEKRKARGG